MTIEHLGPEALKLPVRDRVLLAASLWESIEDPYSLAADLDDEEAIRLAITREVEMESGAVTSISHADLMKRLRG